MKFLFKLALGLLMAYAVLNYRWVHAYAAVALAAPCDAVLLSQAERSVATLYGETLSAPIIGCMVEPVLGQQVTHGSANFAPGLAPVLLVGPQGHNLNVMSHEWAHAELYERLGLIRREFRVPTWLDEGLAMQVDHRADYSMAALVGYRQRADLIAPDLQLMRSTEFFASGDQGKYHYALARCVVARWIAGTDRDWLAQLDADTDAVVRAIESDAGHCDSVPAPG